MKTIFKGLVAGLVSFSAVVAFAQVQGDVNPNASTSACVSIMHNLSYHSRDAQTGGDVSTLQDFLQSKGYLSSEPTGYFGLLTQTAVQKFQSDNSILASGYVGAITRAKILASGCGNDTAVTPTVNETPRTPPALVALCPNGNPIANNCRPSKTTIIPPSTPSCAPHWQCGWGACVNGYQSQTAVDSNNCDLSSSNANIACPALAMACLPGVSSTQPSATILTSTQVTNQTPYIIGTASGVNQVGVVLSSQYGDKAYASGLIPVINGNWSVTVSPAIALGQYTVYVYDANNNQLAKSSLNIVASTVSTQPSALPTVKLIANGGSQKLVNLAWTSTNATNCTINSNPTDYNFAGSWSDKLSQSGTINVSPATKTTYTVTCYNLNGNTSDSVTIDTGSTSSTQSTQSTEPFITLTSPNGGETISRGKPFNITWTTSGVSNAYVSISIITPSNVSKTIASLSADAGSYTWTPDSSIDAGHYKMLITTYANNAVVKDYSDDYFSVTTTSNLTFVLDPSTPAAQSHPVSNTAGAPNVPLAVFNLKSELGDSVLTSFQVIIDSSNGNIGDRSVSKVYLYNGSTLIASQNQAYGSAAFTRLNLVIPKDVPQIFTVTADYPPFTGNSTSTIWIASPTAMYKKPDGMTGVFPATGLTTNKQVFYSTGYVPSF